MIINTVGSIFNSARKDVENAVHAVEHLIENDAQEEVAHVEHLAEKDTSKIIGALHVVSVAGGTRIDVTLNHAAGEVKSLVASGTITLEKLISHLRSLAS